jgi:hypothetical protein
MKTESDEAQGEQAEVDGEVVTVIYNTGYVAWVKQSHQEMGWLEHSKNLKPIQSLEQKARKKAEEIFNTHKSHFTDEIVIAMIKKGIEIDPKTL